MACSDTVARPRRRSWGWYGSCGLLGMLLAVGTGVAQWWQADVRVITTLPEGQINWTEHVVSARERAVGASAAAGARQRLLPVLAQVRVDASRTVADAWQADAGKRLEAERLVATADVMETQYFPGGVVESTVRLSFAGRFTTLLWPDAPRPTSASAPPGGAVHTGVVIDARGLDIQPALFPRLLDEQGGTLYAPATVDAQVAAQRGYVAYAKAFDRAPAQTRVGEQPLVLRALRTSGEARVDLVLQQADVARLTDYAATQLLLQRCQVLILM